MHFSVCHQCSLWVPSSFHQLHLTNHWLRRFRKLSLCLFINAKPGQGIQECVLSHLCGRAVQEEPPSLPALQWWKDPVQLAEIHNLSLRPQRDRVGVLQLDSELLGSGISICLIQAAAQNCHTFCCFSLPPTSLWRNTWKFFKFLINPWEVLRDHSDILVGLQPGRPHIEVIPCQKEVWFSPW